jgi:hypothetical protein
VGRLYGTQQQQYRRASTHDCIRISTPHVQYIARQTNDSQGTVVTTAPQHGIATATSVSTIFVDVQCLAADESKSSAVAHSAQCDQHYSFWIHSCAVITISNGAIHC